MKDYVNEHLPNLSKNGDGKYLFKRIECEDGFTMSVQVGENLYCTPRIDNGFPYSNVEVGFPNKKPKQKEFLKHAEDTDDRFFYHLWRLIKYIFSKNWYRKRGIKRQWNIIWNSVYTETVYPYIPVEIVNKEIELHGGIK